MTLKPEKIDFDKEWYFLKQTIDKVINAKNIGHKEWTERFSNIYRICVANPEPLWERLYFETQNFLDNYVANLFKEFENLPSNELLKQYHLKWNNYRKGLNYLNELYLYINTQHIKKQKFSDPEISFKNIKINEQKLEIRELGSYFWEKNMIEPLKDKLVYLLLEAIENDRNGKCDDENIYIIKDIVLSFVDVELYTKKHELYENVFEKPFLIATGEFYRKEASELVQTCNCSEYMEKAQQRLSAESLRSTKFLHQSSYDKVREECENRMIADHLNLLHSECKNMVLSEARKDLKNMYLLLKNVKDGLPVFIKEVQNYITDIGLKAVSSYLVPNDLNSSNDSKDIPTNFVENILEVHHKFSELIKDVFNSDQQFVRALDKACSTIINYKKNNKYPCKAAELLSKYCDSLLKKSSNKSVNESEIDDKLTMSIIVFRYIDDKDVFQKFFAKMLGKRLIHSLSISMDMEESMINKLKQACGHEFTSKLHRMYTDIRVSGDLIKQFNSWCTTATGIDDTPLSIGFNIFVLQAGAWPIYPTPISPFELPLPLEQCVTKFEKFYYQKFNGRKLTWLHFLSTCDVKMYLDKKTYLVTMSCYLMAILIQFNNSSIKLTYQHLQENTKIMPDEQLTRHLILLVENKLLLLEPNIPNYNQVTKFDSDQLFVFNLNYVNKRTKFRLATLPPKETNQQMDTEQTQASVDENRKLYLQASIVRIMKARKILKHNLLVQEVTQLTSNRFTPTLQMIKLCIEALIEKQYLERTSLTDEYSYVA